MAVLRAPSQFSPAAAGGPVTPSCCGCCCCCCCAGTAVAASIALPMVLHQATRTTAAEPTGEIDHPAHRPPDRVPVPDHRPGAARRIGGIVLAALTIPVSLAVAAALVNQGLAIISAVVAAAMGIGSYLLAGARKSTSVATPLLIMVIAAVVGLIELVLWLAAVFNDVGPVARTLAGAAIVAIPVVTTLLLVLAGRRQRGRRAAA